MSPKILGKQVGPIGFGLMSLGPRLDSDEEVVETIKAAVEAGCTLLDGGEFYGTPDRNSLTFLNKYFQKYPEDVNKVVVNIKGGMGEGFTPDGSKKNIARSIDTCLKLLGPIGRIDQFEPARKDGVNDFEKVTLAAIDDYVKEGKIGGIALSEVNADTIRSAAKSFKITAVELELSLFATDPLTDGVLETCGELGIPVLAYSPLGRGMLSGKWRKPEDIPENNFNRHVPRFQGENFYKNLDLVKKVEALAASKGCTPGQIAINWILALSKRPGMPTIIPIPGSSNADRIRENAVIVDLSDEDLVEIDKLLASFVVVGDRYPAAFMKYLNL